MKVRCSGVSTVRRWLFGFPIFHVPIFGGWRDYVVLSPYSVNQEWHVGWIASDVCGISRIKLSGPVRMLLGPGDVEFFGIDMEGCQIPICKIGQGKIGDGGKYKRTPLL